MTERNITTIVDRLLDGNDSHLNDGIVREIADRMIGTAPPRAVVINLDEVRTKAWGIVRRFSTLGPVEVYV